MADGPEPTRLSADGGWQPLSVERLQEVLPAYEIIELLGAGGMGAVYKARQRSLKRLVAIKILPVDTAGDEFRFVERFRNEAETLAQMNHPAIVGVYDFGETPDGLLYFVMEFVDGTDVHKLIHTNGRLTAEHALAITAHVCDALAYAHRHGVIHRDIKPANILINREGHVKVADFGLAKMHDPSRTGLTMTNMAMGTPDYAAPEVFAKGVTTDHRADLYAVGVMLYQMLTGEVPRGMFKLPSQKDAATDPRFDAIIVKAMESNRDERFQSALEVRHALDEILTTPLAKNDGTGAITASAIPPRSRAASNPQLAPAPSGKAKWFVAAAVVALLGVGAFFVSAGKKQPATAMRSPSPAPTPGATPALDKGFPGQVAKVNAPRKIELVAAKIEALNGAAVMLEPTIKSGVVTGLVVGRKGDAVTTFKDLSPLAALRDLKQLQLFYLNPTDISFLRGLQIEKLVIHSGNFALDVLRDLPLTEVELRTANSDFSVLKGKPLTTLDLSSAPVSDLSFIKGMPLSRLLVDRTKIKDLSPVRGLPLKEIRCDFVAERDTEILRSIPTLERINDQPAEKFWASAGAKPAPAAASQGKLVDLLPLVDVKRDVIAGEWSRDGADLMVTAAKSGGASGTPRLQLPYQPPEEYDFEIEFTPESGANLVAQSLSAHEHSFSWMLDVSLKAGMKAGLDRVDRQRISGRSVGTTMRPQFLTNGKRHRSTVQVRATGVRGLLDDEVLATYGRDTTWDQSLDRSPNEAMRDNLHLGLAALDRAVRFHKITVREITGAGKVDAGTSASGSSSAAAGPATDWLDAGVWKSPWVLEGGVAKSTAADATNWIGRIENGTIRVRFRMPDATPTNAPALQIAVRATAVPGAKRNVRYLLQFFPHKRTCALLYLDKNETSGAETADFLWKEKPFAALGSNEFEFEIRVEGDALSLWSGGQAAASARDARVAAGSCGIIANPGIEITRLETVGVGAFRTSGSAAVQSPSSIANWHDITATVRETARAQAGLVVEPDAVRHSGEGEVVSIRLTEADTRDRAIRLRYTGEGQISLWRGGGATGSAYVLVQRDKTLFKRQADARAPGESIRPSVPHPATFDPAQPHELLLVVQGTTMRVWLDGRFVGEAQDAFVAQTTTALIFTKSTAVQKVEIAELK